jgi:cellulose synthase/poly-beta-1,6-N-acetylglucosamine synthase-like glycosyltransferase
VSGDTERSGAPAMSVVIPSRDRPAALAACLRALGMQEGAPDHEVIVVDDGSIDAAAVATVVAAHGARVVRGEGRGPAAARNLGVRKARAPIVCLTDDDCRPGPGWLAALSRRFADGAAVVAGPTRTGSDDPYAAASQVVTNHLTAWAPDAPDGLVVFAPTSNLAARAEVFASLPFDESFPLAAGEDRDWCLRLAAEGTAIAFEPEAWVDHHPALGLRGFWRQQVRYGRGAAHLRSDGATEGAGLQPPRFYVDLLRAGFAEGTKVGGLVALAQVATATGIVSERMDRRRRT